MTGGGSAGGGSAGGGTGGASGPFDGCPSNAVKIDNAWGQLAIETTLYGAFTDNIVSVRFVPTAGNSTSVRASSWIEYRANAVARKAAFSTRPCDFSTANALKKLNGAPFVITGDVIGVSFSYRRGTPTMSAAGLTPGVPYYINMKNQFADGSVSCGQADCEMRGAVPDP